MKTTAQDATFAITATNVRRSYGDIQAVASVDLHVKRGEIVAILGPNGAGKTTLVEILEGLRRRDSGHVSVLGHDPEHGDDAWRCRIGAVLQHGSDTDEFTVTEMLDAHAAYYPQPAECAEVIAELGLADLAQQRVHQLSGGQRRRLDIALGIIGDPELLFLDEPTTGLDAEVRRAIWRLIRRLAATGTTIVLTTHYLDEVEHLAERTLVLVDGAIVWQGRTTDLRERNAASTVTFELRGPWAVSDLPPSIAACTSADERGQLRIETDDPTQLVADLMQWASSVDDPNPITHLQIDQPSLEDAYLDLLDTTNNPGAPS